MCLHLYVMTPMFSITENSTVLDICLCFVSSLTRYSHKIYVQFMHLNFESDDCCLFLFNWLIVERRGLVCVLPWNLTFSGICFWGFANIFVFKFHFVILRKMRIEIGVDVTHRYRERWMNWWVDMCFQSFIVEEK